MGRPRIYATSVEQKAAWRRWQGMAVRPHYPSAAAKQAAYRARKRQAALALAARECAAIQQALQTRARADQCWELHELIDTWSRDPDMPHRGPEGRPYLHQANKRMEFNHLIFRFLYIMGTSLGGSETPISCQERNVPMTLPRELTHVAAKVKGKLTRVFAPDQLETLAQQSRFIQRSTSKRTGQDFVELMTTDMVDKATVS